MGTDGAEASGGIAASFIPAPFRFCLRCGVSYGSSRMGDYTKLATLATEGRSTATTILSLSAIRHLKRDGSLPADAQKLLSFTDNRQDASLQAGHFNDFVEVGLLRAALYRAVSTAGPDGVSHDELEQRVFLALKSMGVTDGHYAREPGLKGAAASRHGCRAPGRPLVPHLPRPGARVAHHRPQPGAVRAPRGGLPLPVRAVRGHGGLAG